MKRTLSVLLAMLICLSFVGCGGKNSPQPTKEGTMGITAEQFVKLFNKNVPLGTKKAEDLKAEERSNGNGTKYSAILDDKIEFSLWEDADAKGRSIHEIDMRGSLQGSFIQYLDAALACFPQIEKEDAYALSNRVEEAIGQKKNVTDVSIGGYLFEYYTEKTNNGTWGHFSIRVPSTGKK